MLDVQLWRSLRFGQINPTEFIPALNEIASWEIHQRLPFLGYLPRLLRHPNASLRRAAVPLLAGAQGVRAYKMIVDALRDPDPGVRVAAAEALRPAATDDDPNRWVHVLFHPDPAVRRVGLDKERGFPMTPGKALYLLPDSEHIDQARALLVDVTLGVESLPTLLHYARREIVPLAELRRYLLSIPREALVPYLLNSPPRSPERLGFLTSALGRGDGEDIVAEVLDYDPWDDFFNLFIEAAEPEVSAWLLELLNNFLALAPAGQRRVAVAALCAGVRSGRWREYIGELPGPPLDDTTGTPNATPLLDLFMVLVVLEPRVLACSWLPVNLRRQGLHALYAFGPVARRCTEEEVRAILESAVCRLPDHRLDLWACGAVLHLLPKNPYAHFVEWFGLEEVVAAFEAGPGRAIPFLKLSETSPHGRRLLLREILVQSRFRRGQFLARLAATLPGDALDFLHHIDPLSAIDVFRELRALIESPNRPPHPRKLRALADALAPKILAGHVGPFLHVLLSGAAAEESDLGMLLLARVARAEAGRLFRQAIRSLEPTLLPRLLVAVTACAGFPYDHELALARERAGHIDPEIREWAERRLTQPTSRGHGIDRDAHLKPGLCADLREHPDPEQPRVETCLALLACHDPTPDIAEQFLRFGSEDPDFVARLDERMIDVWRDEPRLPLLGHAWLYRWEPNLTAFEAELGRTWENRLEEALRFVDALPAAALRTRLWMALERVLEVWQYRNDPRLSETRTPEFAQYLVQALNGLSGPFAARWLAQWHRATPTSVVLAGVRPAVIAALTLAPESVHGPLRAWIDTHGLTPPAPEPEPDLMLPPEPDVTAPPATDPEPPAPPTPEAAPRDGMKDLVHRLEMIRGSTDLDFLAGVLTRESAMGPFIVAGRRLIAQGEPGLARLLDAAEAGGFSEPFMRLISSTSSAWPAGPGLNRLAAIAARPDLEFPIRTRLFRSLHRSRWDDAEVRRQIRARFGETLEDETLAPKDRFLAGLQLHSADPSQPASLTMVELAIDPDAARWLASSSATWIWERFGDQPEAVARLIASPVPAIYQKAVRAVLEKKFDAWTTADVKRLLELFLAQGTERMQELRREAAERLHTEFNSITAVPILLRIGISSEPAFPNLLVYQPSDVVAAVTTGLLLMGDVDDCEDMLMVLLAPTGVDPFAREDAYAQVLQEAWDDEIRKQARALLKPSYARSYKVQTLADTFAWGVRIGRELTGKLFTIEMITGDQLGYTRFNQNKLYITPMPVLRDEFNGEEIVRALILHEYGHHMYHRGPEAEAVWKEAENKGMHSLLNLVSDEHLERNLRALDRDFGDELKQLAAYAFQHTAREMDVERLLTSLHGAAFEVLTHTELRAARKFGCVAVNNGRLLMQMERAGMSFARFVRALRMGLGDRHDDARVRLALDLFKGKFRHSSMPRLMEIAEELRRIFGSETQMLESFGQDEALMSGEGDFEIDGEGITNQEVQDEVQQSLQGKSKKDRENPEARGGRGINLGPEEHFDQITRVQPVKHDPAAHNALAQRVNRAAQRMRQFFQSMGLGLVPQRYRLRGKSFDKTRARAVVLRNDPRMLIARELQITTDLFLGVVVDCSGSMSWGDRMERARLFGTLLAVAAKGLPGVDVRLFGFTDQVIYDAGSADRCAIHGLEARGGNNDAAGLWHAAQIARMSKRRAKMLVMISDGAPTECTVSALRSLVERLTRRMKMCCAQVAVCPLEHICFPHYVLLNSTNVDESVQQFGQVIVKLVTRMLRGG